MKNSTINSDTKNLRNAFLAFVLIFTTSTLFSQNYRTSAAYIDDFGKNEMYIKKAINDYSQTIVEAQVVARTYTSKETIINKLNNINAILIKNDKGFDGNTSLRDSFIKMSQKTVECLTNGSLSLNDYNTISKLSISDIEQKLAFKEKNLNEYYVEVLAYENAKNEFGKAFNVEIKHIVDNSTLEYNARENFAFYKVNVADEKFINAINDNNLAEAQSSLDYLKAVCTEMYPKVNLYAKKITDKRLNSANLTLIDITLESNTTLFAYFKQYNNMSTSLNNLKEIAHNNPSSLANDEYSNFVQKYNAVKNIYNDTYVTIQTNKKSTLNNFYAMNSSFLKHNLQFEDYRSTFAQAD